jgi:nitrate reductase NapE component
MSTTAILIEFLLSGLQATLWLCLLLATILGPDLRKLGGIAGHETAIAVVLLPFVYPLGVFTDNAADRVLKRWAQQIRQKHKLDDQQSAMKVITLTRHDWLSNYLDYARMRTRICRSSAMNFLMLTFVLPAFVGIRLQGVFASGVWMVAIIAFFLCAGLTVLALWSWYEITNTFHKRVAEGFTLINRGEGLAQ